MAANQTVMQSSACYNNNVSNDAWVCDAKG